MTRKLLVLNVLFLAVAALALASIARYVLTPRRLPGPAKTSVVAAAPATSAPAPAPPGAYGLIAARNLFSPTRTETATEAAPAPIVAKPFLYGVVLWQGKSSIAYLEDPVTKKVNGYRIGDAFSGGRLSAIKRDSVTIERADGKIDVALRDPAKPRPAAASAAVPGAQALPGAAPPAIVPALGALPGLIPRPPGAATPGTPQQPPAVVPRAQAAPEAAPLVPAENPALQGRRLPFNFLRRLPQPPGAPQSPAASQPPTPDAPQGQQD